MAINQVIYVIFPLGNADLQGAEKCIWQDLSLELNTAFNFLFSKILFCLTLKLKYRGFYSVQYADSFALELSLN